VIALALAAILACQDDSVEAHIKALSHADPAVRKKAAENLAKSPYDKLPVLEKHLDSPDKEVGAQVRLAMRRVLESKLGSRKARFELRPFAQRAVMEVWVDEGADPKKVPKGHELVTYADNAEKAPGFERDWVLVEPACVTQDDIAEAQPEPDMGFREAKWLIRFELKALGAEKFDKAAADLFKREPRGTLAVIIDGKIISAPIVNAERFGGKAVIQGPHSEQEARDMARILKGHWLESSMRADRDKDAAPPEKTIEAIRGIRGLDKVTIKPDAAGLDITGFVDTEETSLLDLWRSLRERGYRLVPKK
jgi:preprotein translocase subunit SecD